MQPWRRSALTSTAVLALMLLCSSPGNADTIWTFQNVTFDDGGTLLGTLKFDPTGTLTFVFINTGRGDSGVPPWGAAYQCDSFSTFAFRCGVPPYSYDPSGRQLQVVSLGGIDYFLNITFADDFSTLATGTVPITRGTEIFSEICTPTQNCVGSRNINTALTPIITTPEPSATLLLSLALAVGAVGWRRRQRTRHSHPAINGVSGYLFRRCVKKMDGEV